MSTNPHVLARPAAEHAVAMQRGITRRLLLLVFVEALHYRGCEGVEAYILSVLCDSQMDEDLIEECQDGLGLTADSWNSWVLL